MSDKINLKLELKKDVQSGSDVRLKFKRPGAIRTFDDSDLRECQEASASPGLRMSGSSAQPDTKQVVLPSSVPNHLLMVSMLEQLCLIYSRNSTQAEEIFKSICEQLTNLNVITPLICLDEMSSLRSQYRFSVHRMLKAAIHKSNKVLQQQDESDVRFSAISTLTGSLLALPPSVDVTEGLLPVLPTSITAGQPSITTEDMVNMQTSRYKTEFVELQKIGRGGFGAVYKARNKLDGKIYAVKKVKFKHSNPEVWFKVLREVKALANLQHSNIVGYNGAWLEYAQLSVPQPTVSPPVDKRFDDLDDTDIIFTDSQNVSFRDGAGDFDSSFGDWHSGPQIKELSSDSWSEDSSLGVRFDLDLSTSQLDSQSVQQPYVASTEGGRSSVVCRTVAEREESLYRGRFGDVLRFTGNVLKKEEHQTFESARESVKKSSRSVRFRRSFSYDQVASGKSSLPDMVPTYSNANGHFPIEKSVTLFIQMELCGVTLKTWMQRRNDQCLDEDQFVAFTGSNMQVFRQILKAVDYIHSQGVMHRDLKPRNIFLLEEGLHVKVGDFGLATDDVISPMTEVPLPSTSPTSPLLTRTASFLSEDHTSGVGTSTYAAPEQLQGSLYNTKCDIYSLGVILFELFQKFSTEMERLKSLENLRLGIIPNQLYERWPAQTQAIQCMTNSDPDSRSTARDMLNGELFLSKDQIISDLQRNNTDLQNKVEHLQKMLKERDRVIEELRLELSNSSAFPTTSI